MEWLTNRQTEQDLGDPNLDHKNVKTSTSCLKHQPQNSTVKVDSNTKLNSTWLRVSWLELICFFIWLVEIKASNSQEEFSVATKSFATYRNLY